jgi:DNA-binding IclR family transcriptional regulator
VVAAFEGQVEPLSLADLADRTDLYKSTLLRLIESLEGFGYVVRRPDGRYQLGPAPLRLAVSYQRASGLADILLPIMREMVAAGTESPSFHVRYDEEQRLCTLRADSNHSTLDSVSAGLLLPLSRGAAGRVILAFNGKRGEAFDAVRTNLVAYSYGERDPDCAAVACPVFDAWDHFVGALSLSGPMVRFTKPAVKRMTSLLLDAAIKVTGARGGNTQPLADAKARQA